MTNRKSWLTACGAFAGLLLTTASLAAWSPLTHREYLTFRVPVALPGVTLSAGTYTFERVNADGANVVRVTDRATNKVRFAGFTYRTQRPSGLSSDKGHVVLGEAPRGEAPPIKAWYPLSDSTGFEFIYHVGR